MDGQSGTSGEARVRYGVVGSGMMGVEHIHNLAAMAARPDLTGGEAVQLVALADPHPPSQVAGLAAAARAGWTDVQLFPDVHSLLASGACEVDVVVVATPNMTHAALLQAILRHPRRVHVLVEKPLATSVRGCDLWMLIARCHARPSCPTTRPLPASHYVAPAHAVLSALLLACLPVCAPTGVQVLALAAARERAAAGVVQVGLEYRFMPPVAALLKEVQGGAVGRVHMVAIREHRFPFLHKARPPCPRPPCPRPPCPRPPCPRPPCPRPPCPRPPCPRPPCPRPPCPRPPCPRPPCPRPPCPRPPCSAVGRRAWQVGAWNRFSSNSGGTLVEKCCHFFDLMNLILHDTPTCVMASGGQSVNHLSEEYDGKVSDILDNAYVIVEYQGGGRACLDLCMFAEGSRNEQEICVVGDKGKVEALVPEGIIRVGRRDGGRQGVVTRTCSDERIQ
ncbi:unnamed protein product [Closterium sp. Naga37s-1]|nr:unnamed protein product [Closterium sp. Naga37s-1]